MIQNLFYYKFLIFLLIILNIIKSEVEILGFRDDFKEFSEIQQQKQDQEQQNIINKKNEQIIKKQQNKNTENQQQKDNQEIKEQQKKQDGEYQQLIKDLDKVNYWQRLQEYDLQGKFNLQSSYFLPRIVSYDSELSMNDIQYFFKDPKVISKFEYDGEIQENDIYLCHRLRNLIEKDQFFCSYGKFMIENIMPVLMQQQEITYNFEIMMDKQKLYDQKQFSIFSKIFVLEQDDKGLLAVCEEIYAKLRIPNSQYAGVFYKNQNKKATIQTDEDQDNPKNYIEDINQIFKNQTYTEEIITQVKSISVYSILAFNSTGVLDTITNSNLRTVNGRVLEKKIKMHEFLFEFIMDDEDHIYLQDVTNKIPSIMPNLTVENIIISPYKDSLQENNFLSRNDFKRGQFYKKGKYFKDYSTSKVFIPKNQQLILNYFQNKTDYVIVQDKEDIKIVDIVLYPGQQDESQLRWGKQFIMKLRESSIFFSMNEAMNRLIDQDKINIKNNQDSEVYIKSDMYLPFSADIDTTTRVWEIHQVDFYDPEHFHEKQGPWIIKQKYGKKFEIFENFSDVAVKIKFYKGKVKNFFTVQKFINNPLLIQEKKVDFTVYAMIVSEVPLVAFYKFGFARQNTQIYNNQSFDLQASVCLNHLEKKCQQYTFQQFKELMQQEGYLPYRINRLQDKIKAAITHSILGLKSKLDKSVPQTGTVIEYSILADQNLNVHITKLSEVVNFNSTKFDQEPNFYPQMLNQFLDLSLQINNNWIRNRETDDFQDIWKKEYLKMCPDCQTLYNSITEFNFLDQFDQEKFFSKNKQKKIQKKQRKEETEDEEDDEIDNIEDLQYVKKQEDL